MKSFSQRMFRLIEVLAEAYGWTVDQVLDLSQRQAEGVLDARRARLAEAERASRRAR